jgi:hypothetical protein
MIIQHPDGSYEFRCMPTAAGLLLRAWAKRARAAACTVRVLVQRPIDMGGAGHKRAGLPCDGGTCR